MKSLRCSLISSFKDLSCNRADLANRVLPSLRSIVMSHVLNLASPRNDRSERYAFSIATCTASSASAGFFRIERSAT